MPPGAHYYFEFLIKNQTDMRWPADARIVCISPYVSEKNRSYPLILDGHHKCTFGVEITIPETNLTKQFEVKFVFHSATKKQFG